MIREIGALLVLSLAMLSVQYAAPASAQTTTSASTGTPAIELSPYLSTAGGTIAVSGKGFTPSWTAWIFMPAVGDEVCCFTTSASGAFEVNYTLLSNLQPGVYTIRAVDQKGNVADANVTVIASSTSSTATSQVMTELHFLYPCNCSYDLSWAWPTFNTVSALKSSSDFVVVAQVTSTRTVGVNLSKFPASPFTPPKSLIPVIGYNITVTTVLSGEPGLVGTWQLVSQIGGTTNGTSMSIAGYPTLSVGQSYVFFLTASSANILSGSSELFTLYDNVYPNVPYVTAITLGGPQGLFMVEGGVVYSLDNEYPQADAWLPVKAGGIPLAQFIQDVQMGVMPPQASTSSSSSSSGQITTTTTSCCPAVVITTTTTQTITVQAVPAWGYAAMLTLLLIGVAVGYLAKRVATHAASA